MEQNIEGEMLTDLLGSLPESIESKTEESIIARENWKKSEFEYEYLFEKTKLEAKIDGKKHTGDELKSIAVVMCYKQGCKSIELESQFRRKEKELQRLRDEYLSTQERNYNYRQTMKIIK